ncbi:hypothetical protein KH5_00280 [Urechidicola sp. KH5]
MMNKALLENRVQDFINANINCDITRLLFKGSPFPEIDIKDIVEQIEAKKKCQKKLPTWFSSEKIYFPNKLNIEQSSSEITARYKASLIKGSKIIDITGGFGVDCFYFSSTFEHVTHCEINEHLSNLASYNLAQLNKENIKCFVLDGLEYLNNSNDIYDCIYADPSRRSDVKGRVFLLEDCVPNIPDTLNQLLKKSNNILLKISPLMDITSVISELNYVKEIHVVAVNNEVKELLIVIENNWNKPIKIKTINWSKSLIQKFEFINGEYVEVTYTAPLKYLYEPNAAILKSGGFNQVSTQLSLKKLHKHSHLYTSDDLIDFPGRRFEIIDFYKYNKKKIKKQINSNKANITIRNFPETVEQIRKKTDLKEGGEIYLFFTTNSKNEKVFINCKKL